MFDIGFSELILIGVVALVVIGPDHLPGAARVAGMWVGRIKRSFNTIKEDVERELGADEIRRELHNEGILEKERKMLKDTTDKANQIKMHLFECQSALTYQQTRSLIDKVEKRLNKF